MSHACSLTSSRLIAVSFFKYSEWLLRCCHQLIRAVLNVGKRCKVFAHENNMTRCWDPACSTVGDMFETCYGEMS